MGPQNIYVERLDRSCFSRMLRAAHGAFFVAAGSSRIKGSLDASSTGRIASMNAAIVLIPSFSVVEREMSGTGTGDGRRMKRDRAH